VLCFFDAIRAKSLQKYNFFRKYATNLRIILKIMHIENERLVQSNFF
jgi:hypothetical protein